LRFKYLPKAGRVIVEGINSLMIDIASEAVKKALWPSSRRLAAKLHDQTGGSRFSEQDATFIISVS
jgi:hypothetical protein